MGKKGYNIAGNAITTALDKAKETANEIRLNGAIKKYAKTQTTLLLAQTVI